MGAWGLFRTGTDTTSAVSTTGTLRLRGFDTSVPVDRAH